MGEAKRYALKWNGGQPGLFEDSDGTWRRGVDYARLERERDELKAENARLMRACSQQQSEIQQTLGRALGYPRICDDQTNFPGSTDADGVCVGDHVAETLAGEAVAELTRLRAVEAAAKDETMRAHMLAQQRDEARSEADRLQKLVNTPELHHFAQAVVLEAAHQRERWGTSHDSGKEPADWFWLLGYLGGKALRAHEGGDTDKALHHTISSAAALANWHGAISGEHTAMRPGIDPALTEACGRKG